jgi:microcompartment protein CcmK/EutM
MQIGRVHGTLVSTLKHPALHGHRLLLVQPCDLQGRAVGRVTMAVDVVDAGVGDWVLLLDEGSSASQVLGNARGPIRTLVVGVVDDVHVAG